MALTAVSVEEAIVAINNYFENTVHNPFFVVVDGSEEYTAVLKYFSTLKRIRVSEFCNSDSFANYDALCSMIAEETGQSLLLGLGDATALSGYPVLGKIKDQSISGKVVVMCRGIRDQIAGLNLVDRKFNFSRYCVVDSVLDYSVVGVEPAVHFPAREGFRELLQILENGARGTVYVKTMLHIRASRFILNGFEAIKEQEPAFPVDEAALSMEQWDAYSRDDSLDDYDLFHWRMYLQLKLMPIKDPYLDIVMRTSPTYERYKTQILDAILEISLKDKTFWTLYEARKRLLRDETDTDVSRYIPMTKIKGDQRIYYLTDNTREERYAIISEIAATNEVPKDIGRIYPELAMYLTDYTFVCKNADVFNTYFKKYKVQKLRNVIEEDFFESVTHIAMDGNRMYTALPARNSLLESLDNGRNKLYWIDALGVEFLGYIQSKAKEMGLFITVQIGRSVLPTLTCFNRDFYDAWTEGKKIQTKDLDNLKHKGEQRFNYESEKMPIHLAEELRIIGDALTWAKTELLQRTTECVVIASDHGASRLAVINEHENKWEMSTKGEHSGRCCPTSEVNEKPDTATEERGFWVLANYDRFKGGHKARVEVHGGASLEEVLVPVIQIRLADDKVDLRNETEVAYYNRMTGEMPCISFFSTALLANPRVRFNDRLYDVEMIDEMHYEVIFEDYNRIGKKSGEYTADVLDGDNLIGELAFKIESRSGKNNAKAEDAFFSW